MKIGALLATALVGLSCCGVDVANGQHIRHARSDGVVKFDLDNEQDGQALRKLLDDDIASRIIGGELAKDSRFSFLVSLQNKAGRGYRHFCGGALIHESYVLTAGHCVKSGPPDRVEIGNFQISTSANFNSRHRIIEKVITHPDYYGQTNDIAVLKLDQPCFGCTIVALSDILHGMPQEATGQIVTVAGWGYTKESSGKTEVKLRQVDVPLVSSEACSESYAGIDDSRICAGYAAGQKDACSGDSGGPLFYDDGVHIIQVGVVSYGRGCARAKYYGVYSRVSYFIDFVRHTLWKDSKSHLPSDLLKPSTPKPSMAPTTKFDHHLSMCQQKKSKKSCDKSKSICMWNFNGAPINPNFKATTCIPRLAQPENGGDEDDDIPQPTLHPTPTPDDDENKEPTASPTSSKFPFEQKFCNGQRKVKTCKKYSSRCFWNNKNNAPLAPAWGINTCQPLEALGEAGSPNDDRPQQTREPTPSPTNAPSSSPTTAPTGAPTRTPTIAPSNAPTLSPTFAPTPDPDRVQFAQREIRFCSEQVRRCNRLRYTKGHGELRNLQRCYLQEDSDPKVCLSSFCYPDSDLYEPKLCQ